MLTGRPVSRPVSFPDTAHHDYRTNSDPKPDWTLHNRGNPNVDYIASTFDVAHDNGLRTALFTGKSKFVIYDQSYNDTNGAPDSVGEVDYGRGKIDQYVYNENTDLLVSQFLDQMKMDPFNYAFFHFRDADAAGHSHGWGRNKWDTAVQDVNRYLGQILEMVENDERLKGRTAVILTADHGGVGRGHWNKFNEANYTIPVFVWSPGNIPANVDLYELYPRSIADPGTDRITYPEKPQPMRNGGTGNLALHYLGLLPVPGSMIDSPYFITHCGIEPGKTYDFGEAQAQIEVVKAGTEACVSVGFTDTADTDYWRIITPGEGYEFNLSLPYNKQTIRSPEICPHIQREGMDCRVSKVSETAVTREGITQSSGWIIRQRPETVDPVSIIVVAGAAILVVVLGVLFWRRNQAG
jgi:hypothetical protein